MPVVLRPPILEKSGWRHNQQRPTLDRARSHAVSQPGQEGKALQCLAKAHVVCQQHTRAAGCRATIKVRKPVNQDEKLSALAA
jgi:hypothetical protein